MGRSPTGLFFVGIQSYLLRRYDWALQAYINSLQSPSEKVRLDPYRVSSTSLLLRRSPRQRTRSWPRPAGAFLELTQPVLFATGG